MHTYINVKEIKLISIKLYDYLKIPKVLEFVDENGGRVLTLGSFTLLPQHVVRLILSRDELRADELTKFQVNVIF